MELNPSDLAARDTYKLLTGIIQPRPIAWVSSMSREGMLNLAPFSFFTAVCSNPPTVIFCPGISYYTGQPKDTWRNVEETGEFVINVVTDDVAEQMNITATETEPEINEFELAGVTPIPSNIVQVPRVAESPINIECRLNQIVVINDERGGGAIVIGTVVYFHIDDAVYVPDYKINTVSLKPVGRLAGPNYSRTHHIFNMIRPQPQVTKKD
jgi:flavin reductase (DIM6/NTAB) family NADH-FMN oxidoreductase RutF